MGAFLTTTSICLRVTLSIEPLIHYLNRPQCHGIISANSVFMDAHGFHSVVALGDGAVKEDSTRFPHFHGCPWFAK